MKQRSRVGIPLEQKPVYLLSYEFVGVRAQLTVKLSLSLNEKTLFWGYNVYPLENKDFSIFWYLQVTDHSW